MYIQDLPCSSLSGTPQLSWANTAAAAAREKQIKARREQDGGWKREDVHQMRLTQGFWFGTSRKCVDVKM